MFDSLVQYLMEEVAMDGDEGMDVRRLKSFIDDFYQPARSSTSTHVPQNADHDFLLFVWNTLLQQEGVSVGILRELKGKEKEEGEDDSDEEGEGEEAEGSKAKRVAMRTSKMKVLEPTHELVAIEGEARDVGMDELIEEHGAQLRISVASEMVWKAITGSFTRPASITDKVFSILQLVSRSRGEGLTVVALGQAAGVDQRSAFHYINVPVRLGIVKKFRVTENGAWTNRILHIRYLGISEAWKIQLAHHQESDGEKGGNSDDDEEDDDGEEPVNFKDERMSTISPSYLANTILIRNRIVRVLRAREHQIMPQIEVPQAIGLVSIDHRQLIAFRRILMTMVEQGRIEKMTLRNADRGTDSLCIALINNGKAKSTGSPSKGDDGDDEEEDDDVGPHALGLVAMDRQILDLLADADMEGLLNVDLSRALDKYNGRTIEQTLTRLQRHPPPPHLADFAIRSVVETYGREKRTRWFLLPSYLRRCEREGMTPLPKEPQLDADVVGEWADLGSTGFHRDAKALDTLLGKINVGGGAPPKPKKIKPVAVGGDKEEDGLDDTPEDPTVKKARVRKPVSPKPRKMKPPREGPMTYYERRKLEDAERVRLGLPPKPKRDPSLGGRKPKKIIAAKPEGEEEEEDAADETGPIASTSAAIVVPPAVPVASTSALILPTDATPGAVPNAKPKRGRPKKVVPVVVEAQDPPAVVAEDVEMAVPAPIAAAAAKMDLAALALATSAAQLATPLVSKSKKATRVSFVTGDISGPTPSSSNGAGPSSGAVIEVDSDEEEEAALTPLVPRNSKPSAPKKSSLAASSSPAPPAFAGRHIPRPSTSGTSGKAAQFAPPATPVAAVPRPISTPRTVPFVLIEVPRHRMGSSTPSQGGSIASTSKAIASTSKAIPSPVKIEEPVASIPEVPVKRGRGRPRKTPLVVVPVQEDASEVVLPEAPKKRGRPRKNPEALVEPLAKRARAEEPAGEMQVDDEQEEAVPIVEDEVVPVVEEEVVEVVVEAPVVKAAVVAPRPVKPVKVAPPPKPKAPPAMTFTALRRQKQIMDFVRHNGGIIDVLWKTKADIYAYLKEFHLNEQHFQMDRSVCANAIAEMVNNKVVLQTISQYPLGGRKQTIYLPEIALDSQQMQTHLAKPPTVAAGEKSSQPRNDMSTPRGIQSLAVTEQEQAPLPVPKATDSHDVVRAFFRQDHNVSGAQFGVAYGRFARARELHQFLVEYVSTHEESMHIMQRNPGVGTLVNATILWMALPLKTFLRIIPVAEDSAKLDKYLTNPDNLEKVLADVPANIYKLLLPMSRRVLFNLALKSLVILGLIQAMRPLPLTGKAGSSSASAEEYEPDEGSTEKSNHLQMASTWLLKEVVPIYVYSRKEEEGCPLLKVVNIKTSDDARLYWIEQQAASLPFRLDIAPVEQEVFPPKFPGSHGFISLITSSTKWHDEYMILAPQREYLEDLMIHREHVPFPETDEGRQELEQLASAILAPADMVEAHLAHMALQAKRNASSERKERKRQRIAAGEEDEEDEKEKAEAGASKVRGRASLKNKANQASDLRTQAFSVIVERFRSDHDDVVLEDRIIQHLHGKFQKSILDAIALGHELRLLLPDPASDENFDPDYITIVTSHVRDPPDEYALPKPKRNRRITKTPKVAPKDQGKIVIEYSGTQSEFLSAKPKDVPALEPGRRMPRSFYTSEQNELLYDCAAIMIARSKYTGKRMTWAPVEKLFEGHKSTKLRTYYVRQISDPEEKVYVERLAEAWEKVWNVKRGTAELPDPMPFDPSNFDLAPFVRCLRSNLDKNALRLIGPAVEVPAEIVHLPATIEELKKQFDITATLGTIASLSDRWAPYWKTGMSIPARMAHIENLPFTLGFVANKRKVVSRHLAKTLGALKMSSATDKTKYDEAVNHAILQPLSTFLPEAMQTLKDESVVMKESAGRKVTDQGPGRTYVLADKHLEKFDTLVTSKRLEGARLTEENWAGDLNGEVWPLIEDEGESLAFFHMISEGLIDPVIDVSPTAELRDPSDYQTRKTTDETIELGIIVRYLDPSSLADAPEPRYPRRAPPKSITADGDRISETLEELLETESDTVREVYGAVVEAEEEGISLSDLEAKIIESRSTITDAIEVLTHSTPPLAFWAGSHSPTLISSLFVEEWTIPVTPKGKKQVLVFPAIWLDIFGDLVPAVWEKAEAWTRSYLYLHSGSTCEQIYQAASSASLLTLVEVMIVLETLERSSVVVRKTKEMEEREEGERIEWDEARWFVTERAYKA